MILKCIQQIMNKKPVIAERFITTLKNKIYKYMTAISTKVYIDKLDDIVKIFVIKKIKNTVSWTYIINDLNGEEIIGTFYEKELQGTNQQEFRIEKVIRRKGDKLYVKWRGYNNSFNSWIDKKDIL